MTEKPRETQAESHVVELKEKVNNSSLMKHQFSLAYIPFFMGEYLAGGFSVRGAVSFRQPRFACFDKINELVGATIVGGQ